MRYGPLKNFTDYSRSGEFLLQGYKCECAATARVTSSYDIIIDIIGEPVTLDCAANNDL